MPVGSFPSEDDAIITIEDLMRLRRDFQVSAEALLIRLVKLASSSVACFSATRFPNPDNTADYRIDYQIASSPWSERAMSHSTRRFRSKVLDECVAIGTTSKGTEKWERSGPEVRLEAVALPPLPGTGKLRIAGFIRPTSEAPDVRGIEYRQGNAREICGRARRGDTTYRERYCATLGGAGVCARAVRREYPRAYDDYTWWATETPNEQALGAVHVASLPGNRYVLSLVAQQGYGKSVAPRIRYRALDMALQNASERLHEVGVRMVQMPRIGNGPSAGQLAVSLRG